jgi:hypothetical protein
MSAACPSYPSIRPSASELCELCAWLWSIPTFSNSNDSVNSIADTAFFVTFVARVGEVGWQLIDVFVKKVLMGSAWARNHGLEGERGEIILS